MVPHMLRREVRHLSEQLQDVQRRQRASDAQAVAKQQQVAALLLQQNQLLQRLVDRQDPLQPLPPLQPPAELTLANLCTPGAHLEFCLSKQYCRSCRLSACVRLTCIFSRHLQAC